MTSASPHGFDAPPGSSAAATLPGPHGRRGTRAVQRLVEHAPCTGGLALWVAHRDREGGECASAGAPVTTDGHTLFYAEAFDRLTLSQQTGWVAHAVLHVALRHVQRRTELQATLGEVDAALFNVCADAIVNSALAHLHWLELPASEVRLETLLARAMGQDVTAEAALAQWDVERLYRALDDRVPQSGRSSREGTAKGGGGQEEEQGPPRDEGQAPARIDGPRAAAARAMTDPDAADLAPGTPPDGTWENEAEAARAWRERIERAHASDGCESMLRGLLHDLPRTRTPWTQLLRTRLANAWVHEPATTWARPARSYIANQGRTRDGRRMPFEPGQAGPRRAPRLAVVVDVSGSIDAALLQRFAAEIDTLSRQHGAGGVLIAGDDRVRHVASFEPGRCRWQGLAFEGSGGTDFAPLLAEAGRHRPDIAVVLTDLDGPSGPCPRWPVLWAVPAACAQAVVPFGRKLVLD